MKKHIALLIVCIMMFSSCSFGKNGKTEESSIPDADSTVSEKTESKESSIPSSSEQSESKKTATSSTVQSSEYYTSHGYAFGAASGGKPHSISVNHQKEWDEKGYNALTVDTKTTEKVLYLTFDCGYEVGYTGKILDILKEKDVPAAFFCTLPEIKGNPDLIKRMIDEGHIVGNHSVNHYAMPTLTREKMKSEIDGVDDYLRNNFNYSSKYFRFPTGAYNDDSLDYLTELGIRSVFWSVAHADYDTKNQPGKDVAYKTITDRLHSGAVILLHNVSSSNLEALEDIIDYAVDNGYTFKSLDTYSGWKD